MKGFLSVFMMAFFVAPAFAAAPAMAPAQGRGRASMSNQMMAAPRAVASKNQISAAATLKSDVSVSKSSVKADDVVAEVAPKEEVAVKPDEMKPADKIDMREKERRACLQNNIGVGNTFVWASRYSNLGNYSTMIEDVEEPENNTCFVKVELKSNDSRVNVGDVPSKYYEMGKNITCGAWANYDTIKGRILDAKKSARTWATVGGAVGGAAVGVGAMELFGNEWIGGSVQGQKDKRLSDVEVLKSQLAVLQKDNETEYNRFVRDLTSLKKECESVIWSENNVERPDICEKWEPFFGLAQI